MPAPYREPAPLEPDPPPDPVAARRALGLVRSRHQPPPLWKALIAPAIALGVVTAVSLGAGAPSLWALPAAVTIAAGVAWSSLRDRGTAVAVREKGLVLTVGGAERVVPFEDVDEVWLEIERFHRESGAPLRALGLLTFAGARHRVPTQIEGAEAVIAAVLAGCSQPLYELARVALREGETLRFGHVSLDRAGIEVDGGRASWAEIRKAALHRGRLYLYRRWPVLAWRTIRLDRVPNATVLAALVQVHVRERMRVDDLLLLPYAAEGEILARRADNDAQVAAQEMTIGGAFFVIGVVMLVAGGAAGGVGAAVAAVAYGPIAYGGWRFYRGLRAYLAGRR
jgi:hypothetical protein